MLALKDAFLYLACAHAQMCIIILTNRTQKRNYDTACMF